MYPDSWPKCPACGDFSLDGHLTCGKLQCNEAAARRTQVRERTYCFYCGERTFEPCRLAEKLLCQECFREKTKGEIPNVTALPLKDRGTVPRQEHGRGHTSS